MKEQFIILISFTKSKGKLLLFGKDSSIQEGKVEEEEEEEKGREHNKVLSVQMIVHVEQK